MEGSVLSFFKAEWKVSDTGSVGWASSFIFFYYLFTFEHGLIFSNRPIMKWGGNRRDYNHDSWIDKYLCKLYLSPLKLWIWIPLMARCTCLLDTTLHIWFSPGTLIFSTNRIHHRDITEILLKVLLNTITLPYQLCRNYWLF